MEKKTIVIIIGSSIVLITLAITLFFYYKNPNTSPDNATANTPPPPPELAKTMAKYCSEGPEPNFVAYYSQKVWKLIQDINISMCGSVLESFQKDSQFLKNIRKLLLIAYLNNDTDKMDAFCLLIGVITSTDNKYNKVIEYIPTTNKIKLLPEFILVKQGIFTANQEINFERTKSLQELQKQTIQSTSTIKNIDDLIIYIRSLSFLEIYYSGLMLSKDNFGNGDDIANMCKSDRCAESCQGNNVNGKDDQGFFSKICNYGKCNTNNMCRTDGFNNFWLQVGGDYTNNIPPIWKSGQTAVRFSPSSFSTSNIWFSSINDCINNKNRIFGCYNDPLISGCGYIGNSDTYGPRCKQDVNSGKFWLQLGGDFQNAYLKSNSDGTYSSWLGYGYSSNGNTTQVYNTEAECRADIPNKIYRNP